MLILGREEHALATNQWANWEGAICVNNVTPSLHAVVRRLLSAGAAARPELFRRIVPRDSNEDPGLNYG